MKAPIERIVATISLVGGEEKLADTRWTSHAPRDMEVRISHSNLNPRSRVDGAVSSKGDPIMEELEKIAALLKSIDQTLTSIKTSVFDVDEINALLREILKELKRR